MDTKKLHGALLRAQEKLGYFFNRDSQKTNKLLEGLILNKTRYGYMVCPCRLAAGTRGEDKDIICPCDYSTADVEEYGQCFCGLYLNQEIHDQGGAAGSIPERRPEEKFLED